MDAEPDEDRRHDQDPGLEDPEGAEELEEDRQQRDRQHRLDEPGGGAGPAGQQPGAEANTREHHRGRDGREAALARNPFPSLGEAMRYDHRRILATAIARLRAKLKYRPVVFELMPREFTLTELQHTVEAISGRHLHKQNFRRALERADLVEGLGRMDADTGGRPAELYRFRREILGARPVSGLSLPLLRD